MLLSPSSARFFLVAVGAIGAIGAIGACGQTLSDTNPPEGGALCDGGQCTDADAEAVTPTLCATKTFFVSADGGKDSNSGCSEQDPLRTIAAAIGRAKTLNVSDFEARICAGAYKETLLLDHPLSIHGGYDCFTWKRPDDITYPKLESPLATTIQSDNTDSRASMTIASALVTAAINIDHLTVIGPTANQSVGLLIRDNAAPTIHDIIARGGTATPPPTAITNASALGIGIQSGAKPDISESIINGGSASVASYGAIGIAIVGAEPILHTLTINASQASTPAFGITVDGATNGPVSLRGPSAIRGVSITWDKASITATSVYISGAGADIEMVDSRIGGGPITCVDATACNLSGVVATEGGRVHLDRMRILPGSLKGTAKGGETAAVFIKNAGASDVINSMLFSGDASAYAALRAAGVDLNNTPNVRLAHNTIVTLAPATTTGGEWPISLTASPATIIENNIVASAGSGTGTAGIRIDDHSTSLPQSMRDNAFVGVPYVVGQGNPLYFPNTLLTLENGSFPNTSDNKRVGGASCSGEKVGTCVNDDCDGAKQGCITTVVAGWDATTSGVTTLFGAGWKLNPTLSCIIAKGAHASDISDDHFGSLRTDPRSIGAHETDDCTP